MLTKHITLKQAHRVEKLFDLLFFSMSHSRSVDQAKQGTTGCLRDVNRASQGTKSRSRGAD